MSETAKLRVLMSSEQKQNNDFIRAKVLYLKENSYSNSEIAEFLHIPESSVRSYLNDV